MFSHVEVPERRKYVSILHKYIFYFSFKITVTTAATEIRSRSKDNAYTIQSQLLFLEYAKMHAYDRTRLCMCANGCMYTYIQCA